MDIVQERLEREFNLSLIATSPSVVYRVTRTDGKVDDVDNPAHLPDPTLYRPHRGAVRGRDHHLPNELRRHHHGPRAATGAAIREMEYSDADRVMLHYKMPLTEILMDFFDQLKSRTKGYACFDYEMSGLPRGQPGQDRHPDQRRPGGRALVHHAPRQGLCRGRQFVEKLKEVIRASSSRSASRRPSAARSSRAETVKAFRKNVIAKCYGGDISRKRKLLEKQKEGKKRMKSSATSRSRRRPSSASSRLAIDRQ